MRGSTGTATSFYKLSSKQSNDLAYRKRILAKIRAGTATKKERRSIRVN